MAEISVIMAVYNAEEYLDRSIKSVLDQTFSDWNLICVNDGSTDRSLDILNKYALSDSRIIVLSQINSGAASARSLAYKIASTPYVITLDSDDLYSPNLLSEVYKRAIETGADSVAPNMLVENIDGSFLNWNEKFNIKLDDVMSGREAFANTFLPWKMHADNLWKTELVKKFATGNVVDMNKFNADEYIHRLLFLNTKKVVFSKGEYIYKCNHESITKKFSLKHLSLIETNKRLVDLAMEYDIEPTLILKIEEFSFRNLINLQTRLYADKQLDMTQREKMQETIKCAYKSTSRIKDFSFSDKKKSFIRKVLLTNGFLLFQITCFGLHLSNRQKI